MVIDHPESIIRCGNKVYQAELFERHNIPAPTTMVVHEGNVGEVAAAVGLPCVLKRPDGSFSPGVARVETQPELRAPGPDLFEESELVVAQAFTPSSFDWRVGVLDRKALFVGPLPHGDGPLADRPGARAPRPATGRWRRWR